MVSSRRKNIRWVDIGMAEVKLDKLKVHFAQSNKAEGKSPKTISWYSEMLDGLFRFLESHSYRAILSDLNIDTVREFIVHEQERGMSPYTVQGKVRALKAFSSWLFREGYTIENLVYDIKLPKVPAILIEPLTVDEIDQLVNYQNPLTAIGCRNIGILILMLDTGVRLSELCRLHFEDTHVEEGFLKVMGKGRKERVVPLGATTQKMLWRYILHFRPEPKTLGDLQFSFQHILAAAMLDGDVKLEHFIPERVQSTDFKNARDKVQVIVHYDWPSGTMESPAVIDLILTDGRKFSKERQYAIGSPKEPLKEEQFRYLYHKFTQGLLNDGNISQTANHILNVEQLNDIKKLLNTLTFGTL